MTITTESAEKLQAFVDGDAEIPDLRPFPQVASQILSACEDPNIGPKDLANIIQCDPALSMRILQVANSSMYGFSGEISSIDRAVVALGFRSMKSLAVSAAASDVFESGDESTSKERKKLWLHSLATGTMAALIAPGADLNAEEAFLAGVVHDVGKLVFFDIVTSDYAVTRASTDSTHVISVENDAFGVDHQQLGECCADEWGLPTEVADAIACHHEPENASTSGIAGVVCVANSFARYLALGGPEGTSEELLAAIERSELDLTVEQLEEEVSEKARVNFEALRSTCK